MCVPLRMMGVARWRRKRTVVLLHCSISGDYLNSGLKLELGSKKCFMSKVLGLRCTTQRALLASVLHPQQERAGVLGTVDKPL